MFYGEVSRNQKIQSLRSIDPVKFFAIKNKTLESWVELLIFLRHPGTIMDSLKEY